MEVRSEGSGQGSEFTVRLPVLLELQPHLPPQPAGSHAAPRRILVVDDNRDAAESLALLLKCHGHEVSTALDGLEAVETAARLQPDVVLLDIGLPGLDGYEAARRIREQQGSGVLLVAVTGWGHEEALRLSKQSGFTAHLVKPVTLDALTKILVNAGETVGSA